jgi:hypothetical protein
MLFISYFFNLLFSQNNKIDIVPIKEKNINNNICDMKVLTSDEISYIRLMPKDKLLKLIELLINVNHNIITMYDYDYDSYMIVKKIGKYV